MRIIAFLFLLSLGSIAFAFTPGDNSYYQYDTYIVDDIPGGQVYYLNCRVGGSVVLNVVTYNVAPNFQSFDFSMCSDEIRYSVQVDGVWNDIISGDLPEFIPGSSPAFKNYFNVGSDSGSSSEFAQYFISDFEPDVFGYLTLSVFLGLASGAAGGLVLSVIYRGRRL